MAPFLLAGRMHTGTIQMKGLPMRAFALVALFLPLPAWAETIPLNAPPVA